MRNPSHGGASLSPGSAIPAKCLFVAPVLAQQFHHVLAALIPVGIAPSTRGRRRTHGRNAYIVASIDIGPVGQQQFRKVGIGDQPNGKPG